MEALRPNYQRANNAILFVWIVMISDIASFVSDFFQYNSLQSLTEYDEEQFFTSNITSIVVGLIGFVVTIISIVTFILWFRRAYYNLHLRVDNLSFSEGWASGSWFVPILSLFRPYQIMKELYEKTDIYLSENNNKYTKSLTKNSLPLWWALWIFNNIIGQISFRYPTDTISDLRIGTIIQMVTSLLGVPLAIITVKVIKDYSKSEQLLK